MRARICRPHLGRLSCFDNVQVEGRTLTGRKETLKGDDTGHTSPCLNAVRCPSRRFLAVEAPLNRPAHAATPAAPKGGVDSFGPSGVPVVDQGAQEKPKRVIPGSAAPPEIPDSDEKDCWPELVGCICQACHLSNFSKPLLHDYSCCVSGRGELGTPS